MTVRRVAPSAEPTPLAAPGSVYNAWVVGDERETIVIDAPHDAESILSAVAGRRVLAVLCTHAAGVRAAPDLAERTGAPIWVHPEASAGWYRAHPVRDCDCDLALGQEFSVGAVTLEVISDPTSRSPGVVLYSPTLGCVFTGALTGVDAESAWEELSALPPETVIHPGHGPDSVLVEHLSSRT